MNTSEHAPAVPKTILTPGAWLCLALVAVGLVCGLYRFFFGLQASTNLSQQYPWGIWIVADVSFIALAAGGFVVAAIAHILHRTQYHALVRPALITAMLGYTFACILLAADLGRYYNIWHPLLPSMWQGNSALFEVGMCVMCYLTVLYIEFVPVFCERFANDPRPRTFARACGFIYAAANRVLPVFIILGVAISCLHQSSLGNVMVLAPTKLHPLWWSPILSLLFLISAIVAGAPTVIFASICGSWSLGIAPPMRILSQLAKFVPLTLCIYLAIKITDMVIRGTFVYLSSWNLQSSVFVLEIVLGLIIPIMALLSVKVRNSPRLLAGATFLVMLGIVLNRAAVYWIGYKPATLATFYTPSLAEWGFTIGAAACVAFAWRALAILFPIVSLAPAAGSVRHAVVMPSAGVDGRTVAKRVPADYLPPRARAALKG